MFSQPPALDRPEHLPDDNWSAITAEEERLSKAISDGDSESILGALKSLVESVARVAKDIAGEPADNNADFTKTLTRAHDLLCNQRGYELANEAPFSTVASQARKIAGTLGVIRNEFGTGHGRARPPKVLDEMVALSLDGGMMWTRWALRRLGPFAFGRPGPLIEALRSGTFYSGVLRGRLEAANLPGLEQRHQRAVGVAVGQRVMRETFVVRWDGLDPCRQSDELDPWTTDYRQGLATGLVEDEDGRLTLTPHSVQWLTEVVDPIPDNGEWLTELVDRIIENSPPMPLRGDEQALADARTTLVQREEVRPEAEKPAWLALRTHLFPDAQPV